MIVIDGSIALLWFLPQPGSQAARALLVHENRIAPDILPFEVASVLLRASRRGEISQPQLRQVMGDLLPAAVTLMPEPMLHQDALDIASQHGGSIADCCYIALARRLDGRLATADARQAAIARAAGVAVDLLDQG